MATNLDHNLPRIRLITTKLDDDQNPQEAAAAGPARFSNGGENDHHENKITAENGHVENLECRTPTSDANKIPRVLVCPPAPRKPTRKPTASCKRKLFGDDLGKFLEIVNCEEVDEFFRSSFELVEKSRMIVNKKRCKCT